jgi:hypothetical protein
MRYAADRYVLHLAESGREWNLSVDQRGNQPLKSRLSVWGDGDASSLLLTADECERIAAALSRAAAVLRDGA